MPKKVSADTISDLTAQSGFSAGAKGAPPPTAEEMIKQIRANLKLQAESLAKQVELSKAAATDPAAPPNAFEIAYQLALKQQKDFEQIVADVPKGFRLTPVLYSKITYEQNTAVKDEYRKHVRRHFLRYVAEHHADELSALGICPQGIDRMRKGLDPADANGVLYKVNIDHIVERSGGGQMSLQKAADPLLPPGSNPTYLVNHLSNMILLPEQVHEAKNLLNEAQQAAKTKYGESRWVLMLIPETGLKQSGFVAVPQDRNHYLFGIEKRQLSATDKIRHASFITDQAQAALEAFRKNPAVKNILKSAQSVAKRQKKTVVGLMQEEETCGTVAPQHRLSSIFNQAVASNPAQKEMLETSLKPALLEAAKRLRTAFDDASKPGHDKKDYDDFVGFYQGKKIKALRQNIEKLPLKEAAELHEALLSIDREIQAHLGKLGAIENKKPGSRHKRLKRGPK